MIVYPKKSKTGAFARSITIIFALEGKSSRMSSRHLFCNGDVRDVIRKAELDLESTLEGLKEPTLLSVGPSVLAKELADRFKIEVPEIHESEITVSHRETPVDISRDFRYAVLPGEHPFKQGIEVTFHLPYTGDANLFECRPNVYDSAPPRASIRGNELLFAYTTVDHVGDSDQMRREFDRQVSGVRQYLNSMRVQVDEYNSKIFEKVLNGIERRKQKLMSDRGLVASLGFPVRRRTDPSPTYGAPIKRRKLPVRNTPSKPFEPEPALLDEEYDHILSVVSQMNISIERSPHAFSKMKEEDLRQFFVVSLNGHYEGQATGETFNFQGKTDILIRVEGRNIFIGECKYWTGEKGLLETVDQLLSYSSWRDTKAAILLFNRNKEFSKMLEKVAPVVEAHPNFIRRVPYNHETASRFIMRHRDDPDRELTLTVLAFNISN